MARDRLRGTTHGRNDVFEDCIIVDCVAIGLNDEGVGAAANRAS